MIPFLLYISSQTFRDYYKALAFLSCCFVIIIAAVLKFIILKFQPEFYPRLKAFFQLSIFLFIPLFLTLIYFRYKHNFLNNIDTYKLQLPRWACITILILLELLLVILFVYILIAE